MGVSMTPGVWSQRQMDEEVDKAGENRWLLWRSRKLYSGPLECRWRTASYKETTARSSAGTHVSRCWFQRNKTAQAACGSTRGMARAGIGVFSEVTGACLGLKNIISCPLFVARSVNAMYGDSAAFILRELTGIRLRRRFASLEMG